MNRENAMLIIAKDKLEKLSEEERKIKILDWWNIDSEDDEFELLSKELQTELNEYDYPPENTSHKKYNQLLHLSIRDELVGVKNEYLSKLVSQITSKKITVIGELESLERCPCCNYLTLRERGQYEICPICFWEDDGTNNFLEYSSPNHMSIEEYRLTKVKIDIDLKERYKTSDNKL